jgi:Na+/pantothenate symporter
MHSSTSPVSLGHLFVCVLSWEPVSLVSFLARTSVGGGELLFFYTILGCSYLGGRVEG